MINGLASPRGVRTQHPDYIKFLPKWTRCRDVISGQDTMQAAGPKYIPKLRDQEPVDYINYVLRASFFNATGRTVDGLVGMLFRKEPAITVAEALVPLLADVDTKGRSFLVFAKEVAEEVISVGRVGVLVDYAKVAVEPGETITIAAAQAKGLRPTLQQYPAETIINWKFTQQNGAWALSLVVLTEQATIPVDEFGDNVETHYRVLDIDADGHYRVRVFRINEKDDSDQLLSTDMPLMNGKPLPYVPFVAMTPDGISFDIDEPPLLDLVDVNIAHYRSSADYEHGCHFTALPTLFISGYRPPPSATGEKPPTIYLGSQAAIIMAEDNAKASFVEFTGNGLGTIEKSMDRKERQMAILGARMISGEKAVAETATTTAIHRIGENAVLSDIAIALSLGLGNCLTVFSQWAGADNQAVYKVNREFLPVGVDGQALVAYVQAWQAGALSDTEMFDLLQRGDLIDAEESFDDHKAGVFSGPDLAAKQQPNNPKPKNPTNAT